MNVSSTQTRPLGAKFSSLLQRIRRPESRHDDRLRADRQVARPRTSLIALINGGRGSA